MSRNTERKDSGGDQISELRVEVQDPNLPEGRWETITSPLIAIVWVTKNMGISMKSNIDDAIMLESLLYTISSKMKNSESDYAKTVGSAVVKTLEELHTSLRARK